MAELYETDITYLKGVGPKRAIILKQEAGIGTIEDLLYYFPYKYIDRSRFFKVREITAGMPYVQLIGRIKTMDTTGKGYKQRLNAIFSDDTGSIELVWFKGIKYIAKSLKTDVDYILFGKPSLFNGRVNVVHPELEKYDEAEKKAYTSGLQAAYPTTEKMKSSFLNSKAMLGLVTNAFETMNSRLTETLPAWLLQKHHFPTLTEALREVHFPTGHQKLAKATERLKFEELFYIQLNILRLKNRRSAGMKGHVFSTVGHLLNTFYKTCLPFKLTEAQKRVIREIRQDAGSGKQMNRLLQGDVGSGKTLVALMVMLIALDNGYQATMMAPTEILANQHYNTLVGMLDGMDVKVGLLTGSTKKSERTILHEQLQNGGMQILVGTHALIEDTVKFHNLGLVIIDEQHRFGVAQRARLWKKNTIPPHVLVMTATPIPRTLAMTLYGDLDVSVIDELPPGRKPIKTAHFYEKKRKTINEFIDKQVALGQQVYMVYPLIQESEALDYKNLEEGYEYMKKHFPHLKISMVHGKMKPSEKDAEMMRFKKGETHIMVATTVIEVGVDVPNATVMVIESAERFGLSQLHQLRGRVGRGGEQSYCILVSSPKLSEDGRKRLETMVATTDGFEIAEADLKLRGPGDLEGTQQSGLPFDLKIANLAKDGQILQLARDEAGKVLDDDPLLEKESNTIFSKQLTKLSYKRINWGLIS
ncbi:ATP-dependent DNA helicase RecG [Saccharicrinis sp. FJH54]|uniref:ATP-dependent DNA helicase RecG n=1 Tax=Saccharicrinis sp. FJH54 TaxID=3344665 RepID=UPI0035D4999E